MYMKLPYKRKVEVSNANPKQAALPEDFCRREAVFELKESPP